MSRLIRKQGILIALAVGLLLAPGGARSAPKDGKDKPAAAAKKPAASAKNDDNAKLEVEFPDYTPGEGVSGTIKSVGSDSMLNLMTAFAEGFIERYPNVKKEIEGKGSATAPTALIAGTAIFGPMSREMKSAEIDEFEKKFGYKPSNFPAAIDMLAVFVHKDNPITGLSLKQIDAVFSKSRKGGAPKELTTWGDLGLKGEWANKPIRLYGRDSASGTYGYFKEHALFKGDFKDSVKEQPGSSAVVQKIAADKFAIGYSGIGYATTGVRAVPLASEDGEAFVPAQKEFGYDGTYPLSRDLLIYLNHEPKSELDPLRREFIRYVFSKQGQLDVVKEGYLPLVDAAVREESLKSLGIEP